MPEIPWSMETKQWRQEQNPHGLVSGELACVVNGDKTRANPSREGTRAKSARSQQQKQWRQEQNLHGLVSGELACVCRTASFRQRRTLALGSRCDSRDFGPLRLILHAVPGPARRGRALALVLSATCSLLCLFLSPLLDPRCTGTTLALQGPPTAVKKGEARSARGRAR